MTSEQIQARNNLLESDNRLLAEKLKKAKKEFKLQEEKINNLEQDALDYKDLLNNLNQEIERCESCNHLFLRENMSYVGNELICEMCNVNGYGR